MAENSTSSFAKSLKRIEAFSDALPIENYKPVPDDWMVAVTDVVQSRAAIANGQFKAVNMAGVAMITAIMNALDHQDIPYIFGGDGAAVAVAPEDYDVIKSVLAKTVAWVEDELSLELRASIVPVSKVRELGADVLVAGLEVSEAIINYAFLGGGIGLAEKLMKDGEYRVDRASGENYPDLTGLSCRWMPVEKKDHKIISLIVEPAEGAADIPDNILQDMLELVRADKPGGRPVSSDELKFKWQPEGVDLEARAARVGKFKLYAISLIAMILDKTGFKLGEFDPVHYRNQLALNTDYRKIQDGIRMTLCLDMATIASVQDFLEKHRSDGHLRFGVSEQDKAVLTCFVPSITSDDHYHFLDGAGGGYAAAADNLH